MLMYATKDVEAFVASLHVCYPIMNSERSLRSSLPLYSDGTLVVSKVYLSIQLWDHVL